MINKLIVHMQYIVSVIVSFDFLGTGVNRFADGRIWP